MFRKILIANRGEIAVRILRACREMGIATVAVYSEADEQAPHVHLADEAYPIGPAPATESYLNIPKLIEVARKSGAEAVHPGYGFLAENPAFARAVQEAGLTFIGPPPEAMALMGDKAQARQRMAAAGVPVVPGVSQVAGDEDLVRAAERIGYPVLLKAAAGGGGKGMRVVWKPKDLKDAADAARREAASAFGDDRLIVEKYVPKAHHVEVQVLADAHGRVLALYERECSVQRRYQKIIEETPSPVLVPETRQALLQAAVQAARAVGYTNAGTVEFILDPDTQAFYFLEMNTRLQVEHPITEMVLDVDLVQWQIRVAAGEPLPAWMAERTPRGHAIEARVYAEDPAQDFFPTSGRLLTVQEPQGPGIRVDSGAAPGLEVTPYYDPLLAKIIAHGEHREQARLRLLEALRQTVYLGLSTNIPFLLDVLQHPDFIAGRVHTRWVEEVMLPWEPAPPEPWAVAAAAWAMQRKSSSTHPTPGKDGAQKGQISPWQRLRLWYPGGRSEGS